METWLKTLEERISGIPSEKIRAFGLGLPDVKKGEEVIGLVGKEIRPLYFLALTIGNMAAELDNHLTLFETEISDDDSADMGRNIIKLGSESELLLDLFSFSLQHQMGRYGAHLHICRGWKVAEVHHHDSGDVSLGDIVEDNEAQGGGFRMPISVEAGPDGVLQCSDCRMPLIIMGNGGFLDPAEPAVRKAFSDHAKICDKHKQ